MISLLYTVQHNQACELGSHLTCACSYYLSTYMYIQCRFAKDLIEISGIYQCQTHLTCACWNIVVPCSVSLARCRSSAIPYVSCVTGERDTVRVGDLSGGTQRPVSWGRQQRACSGWNGEIFMFSYLYCLLKRYKEWLKRPIVVVVFLWLEQCRWNSFLSL